MFCWEREWGLIRESFSNFEKVLFSFTHSQSLNTIFQFFFSKHSQTGTNVGRRFVYAKMFVQNVQRFRDISHGYFG